VQETLVKAWFNRHRLRDARYFQTWVIRILINECRNIQRKLKKTEPLANIPPAPPPDEDAEALREALMRLDIKYRLPVVLYYIEGFNTKEIAGMLGIPKGTVTWRMARARKLLGIELEEN
jgi:RNA polymerase sigma-70 factor (ECF subfamily)